MSNIFNLARATAGTAALIAALAAGTVAADQVDLERLIDRLETDTNSGPVPSDIPRPPENDSAGAGSDNGDLSDGPEEPWRFPSTSHELADFAATQLDGRQRDPDARLARICALLASLQEAAPDTAAGSGTVCTNTGRKAR